MRLRRDIGRTVSAGLVALALLGLSGCENSKDKAARHLASALELAQKGDGDRALVEFRNVFKLDPENIEARRSFADFLLGRGDLAGAYAQYQAVIDRSPADQAALRAAAQVAGKMGNWPEAARQADALLALAKDDAEMTAVKIAADYAKALSSGDKAGRETAAGAAEALLASRPEDLFLHRVVIDSKAQAGDYDGAIAATDAAIAIAPGDAGLQGLRVSLLAAKGDKAGVETALQGMEAKFPADPSIGQTLLRWYMSNGQTDKAEAWLRGKAKAEGDAGLRARVQLALFLKQFRDTPSALAEIDAALKLNPPESLPDSALGGPDAPVTGLALRVLRASMVFDAGQHDEAIAAMKAILAPPGGPAPEPSDQTRMTKVNLARMLMTTGDQVQARALVEEVLAEDAGNVEASKMKAAWDIDGDKTEEAIALLRAALESAPRDAQTMSLLAEAYGRAGNRDLQSDMLAQAVEASGKAPAETLRYAARLVEDQKYLPAESLLVDALRLDPANVDLLAAMGDLYIRMKDWPRAEGVADRLVEIGTDPAKALADRLKPAILAGRDDIGAAVDYIKGLAETSPDADKQITLVSAYLAQGKTDEARKLADALLAKSPADQRLRFVVAAVKGASGDGKGALADLRAMVDEDPGRPQLWLALIRQAVQVQGPAAAGPLIDEGLGKIPDQPDLLLMKAGLLEQDQDIDGAIAIYDKLYAQDSSNLIYANNLASLLASWKTDAASLERAWAVARRLNGTDVPAFADTYGWIAHLRGQSAEALPYLEKAAAGLQDDALTQFHYAEVLKANGKAPEAKAQYAKVLGLVPETDARAFVATARKEAAAP